MRPPNRTLASTLLVLILGLGRPAGAEAPVRTLFIGLDAVPYRTVARLADPELGDRALFRGLEGPAALISTFPSTTSLAFAGILEPIGLDKSPGYEAKFFDWEGRRVRGGGLVSYQRIAFPWREFWDWKLPGLWAKLKSGVRPVKVSFRSIRRSLDAFVRSDKEVFFIYYTTFDLVSHLKSPAGLEPVLRRLDEALAEVRREHPDRPFRSVLFSDHGMDGGEPLRNVRKATQRALRRAGYRPARKLRRENHVATAPFGLVSSFVAFTVEDRKEEVAAVLGRVEGVHVCATPAAFGGFRVEGREGSAVLRRTGPEGGELWSYEPIEGDPLRLRDVVEQLRERAGDPDADVFPDRWWLEATRARELPDPLYRIARGFDLVENPASVICGTSPGYMYGARSTELASRLSVGRLKWTHGALDREASLGFLMSDFEGWEAPAAPMRFNEALLPFLERLETPPSALGKHGKR
jgi:hypothetical protein